MNLIVDTSVWSLVLRRQEIDETNRFIIAFRRHIQQGDCLHLLGNILQELLDGVKNRKDFDRLVELLEPFPLLVPSRKTYVRASQLRNHCRAKGIQATPVDFLIASACLDNGYPLLTSDGDFTHIAKHCDLTLL